MWIGNISGSYINTFFTLISNKELPFTIQRSRSKGQGAFYCLYLLKFIFCPIKIFKPSDFIYNPLIRRPTFPQGSYYSSEYFLLLNYDFNTILSEDRASALQE